MNEYTKDLILMYCCYDLCGQDPIVLSYNDEFIKLLNKYSIENVITNSKNHEIKTALIYFKSFHSSADKFSYTFIFTVIGILSLIYFKCFPGSFFAVFVGVSVFFNIILFVTAKQNQKIYNNFIMQMSLGLRQELHDIFECIKAADKLKEELKYELKEQFIQSVGHT